MTLDFVREKIEEMGAVLSGYRSRSTEEKGVVIREFHRIFGTFSGEIFAAAVKDCTAKESRFPTPSLLRVYVTTVQQERERGPGSGERGKGISFQEFIMQDFLATGLDIADWPVVMEWFEKHRPLASIIHQKPWCLRKLYIEKTGKEPDYVILKNGKPEIVETDEDIPFPGEADKPRKEVEVERIIEREERANAAECPF